MHFAKIKEMIPQIYILAFALWLWGAAVALAETPNAWLECEKDSDCLAHEAENCCMPWFSPYSKKYENEFLQWFGTEQRKYIASECACPWDYFEKSLEDKAYTECLKNVAGSVRCVKAKCELGVKGVADCKK